MRSIFKSRRYQIVFVTASLLFVLWISISMWMDAFNQRQNANAIMHSSVQEEKLLDLADAISAERRLFYRLFNTSEPNPSSVAQLRAMSEINRANLLVQIKENTNVFSAVAHDHSPAGMIEESSHESVNGKPLMGEVTSTNVKGSSSSEPTVSDVVTSGVTKKPRHHSSSETMHHEHMPVPTDSDYRTSLIKNMMYHTKEDTEMYEQLSLSSKDRKNSFGMMKFHDYSLFIESIDGHRRSLYIIPIESKREFYIHEKLKDVIWNLRESIMQLTSLIEGVIRKTGTANIMAGTSHHADMLMELHIRIELAWSELLQISNATESAIVIEHANETSAWYTRKYRPLSSRLSASSKYNAVTVGELYGWLKETENMLDRVESVRADSKKITLDSVSAVGRSALFNLILVSVLVVFAIGMALGSIIYFRKLDIQAHQDELTGLDNRRLFGIKLNNHIGQNRHAEATLGILMIDLDHFKYINDTMGHAAGDQLLQDVSARMQDVSGDCQSIARLGGDEFAMLYAGFDTESLLRVANDVREALIEPFDIDGAIVTIGSSIGICQYPDDATTHDSLIQAADLAMYCAKKSGTNKIVQYDCNIDLSMASTARMVTDLKKAIQQEQFELHYQPQYNLAVNKVVSVEALIRWNHPERGLISPNDFIPVAEENGLLPGIGNWVINEACRQGAVWLHQDKLPLRVAVNISADHFFQPRFVETVLNCLETHKLPPQFLELEVTETLAMNDMGVVVESLRKLRESAIHVALDDFGTGYSSLSYLQDLPLDTLKIDKSFIQKIQQGNLHHDSITQTIVSLGKSLDLETVAEGVETIEQLCAVSDMSISVVQGYYYSKPVSAADLPEIVNQINSSCGVNKAA